MPGTDVAVRDFGGDGPAVLLLHGLSGHSEEWAPTAAWLARRARVVAYDARGHGASERSPADVSPEAQVADAVSVIEALDLAPVVIAGHSLGGHTALLVAAEHPELVRGLIVAEASPSSGDASGVGEVGAALARWPVPFATREDAIAFFGGPSLRAEAWARGLEQREDGWWPRFDPAVMERTLREAMASETWSAWDRIACPVLIVRAAHGIVPEQAVAEMSARNPGARLAEVPGGHDVHLERPDEWRAALTSFLDGLGP